MLTHQTMTTTGSALRVDGELTIYRASDVAQTLFAAIREHDGDMRLDLSEVTEFDTAGLQLVLMARRIVEEGGHSLELVRPSECVADVLKLCNVPHGSASIQSPERQSGS